MFYPPEHYGPWRDLRAVFAIEPGTATHVLMGVPSRIVDASKRTEVEIGGIPVDAIDWSDPKEATFLSFPPVIDDSVSLTVLHLTRELLSLGYFVLPETKYPEWDFFQVMAREFSFAFLREEVPGERPREDETAA